MCQVPVPLPAGTLARLIGSLAPDRIILFGSYAKGTAKPGSDIDLLLVGVWNGDLPRILRQTRQLVAHSFPPIDPVLCTPSDIIEAEQGKAPFLRSVIESGLVIWQRADGR
jgi:predicted nucleotidyltransferase